MKLPYNAIFIEPFLHEINIVITTKYLATKFPPYKRISTIKGNQMISKECNSIYLMKKNSLHL
jgi:hypothetical protein